MKANAMLFRPLWLVLGLILVSVPSTGWGQVTPEQAERIREAAPDRPRVAVDQPRKLLVWSRSIGFQHSSIPHGAFATKVMGEKTGAWEATETTDIRMLLPENLHGFDGLVINNTTGDWITPRDTDMESFEGSKQEVEAKLRKSVLDFVAGGGGLIGYHSATDSNYHWEEFGRLMGGYFNAHPWHEEIGVVVQEPDHVLSDVFTADRFRITDEIYQFKEPYSRQRLRVLKTLDTETSNMDKRDIRRDDGDFAISWIRTYGKGRVFYGSLGHREEIFWNPQIMRYYRDGIQYALGDLDADALPSDVVDPSGYQTLFDGSSLDAWTFPEGSWGIDDDGQLGLAKGGGYIWTDQTHGDFILDLEFKVSAGCNSGVFFRTDPSNPVQGGFEIQLMDTAGKDPAGKHDCGALYDAAAPLSNPMRAAGEWNRMVLTCDGPLVQVILNGQVIQDVNLDRWDTAGRNPDGSGNKFTTALKDLPRTGKIGFQDYGNPIWFRNIRIKPLGQE
ncbi:MAG: DUF1080 domain-containing protein [Planctomycetaceae bacterium]|nr:MAG: DUF1080 domain-containing protein [Planctomycetaceae bacterium]